MLVPRRSLAILALVAASCPAVSARAQSTAFTYQGRLQTGGQAASGPHDLRFRLFDAASGGAQIGANLCLDNIAVSAGLFTVQLDFGQQFASTAPRHLEIDVRADTGLNCTNPAGFVLLTPRQQVTAAPLATHAKAAFTLAAADGSPNNAVFVDNGGQVGILTPAPAAGLHVNKEPIPPGGTLALEGTTHAYQTFFPNGIAGGRRAFFGFASAGTPSLSLVNESPSGHLVLVPGPGGGVGIGTNPTALLHAAGNAANGRGAVYGVQTGGSEQGAGVYGVSELSDGNGVIGLANNGVLAYGVWGRSTGGQAGHFDGTVQIIGNLSKSGGSFQIDHPLDPANKYLFHSFVESPDMMNIYNGTAVTDQDGYATVTLPEWFQTLNRDFRYQLTVIDESDGDSFVTAKLVRKIAGNRFTFRTSAPGVEVSWQVTGIRQDPWANAHRIPVEQDKPAHQRGYFQHPELYGQPPSRSTEAARLRQ